MTSSEKNRSRLITLLKELFQLDQPELDFGLYKIMHAKSEQVLHFLENDLLEEIRKAFGDADNDRIAEAKAKYEEALETAKKFGAANPEETDGVKEAKAAYDAAREGGNSEAEVYDHLYRFFERYYDAGDFMSRRYYARESESLAAPYAVPYDGREVYLHWANKDQYYIKSSEYLSNYRFELNEAIKQEASRQTKQKGKGIGLELDATVTETPLRVNFRIVQASEEEHGNIKAGPDQKRFFILHANNPVVVENDELVIQFEYREDEEKTGQDNTWQLTRLLQAEEAIISLIRADDALKNYYHGLTLAAPTDKQKNRSLLGKHLQKYAAKHSFDYFIHKDLGAFLRRELDSYIKNEVMRLDDIEQADVPQVNHYLVKLKVLRRIAKTLIQFLSSVEDFQKKIWEKKKFVIETNYCLTMDKVPEDLYEYIISNEGQIKEWIDLFSIDEDEDSNILEKHPPKVSKEFLKKNKHLVLDTAYFNQQFKYKLLSSSSSIDQDFPSLLIHSENYHALSLIKKKYSKMCDGIYIDPPYNTSGNEIVYKNSYKHSSWCSLLHDRISISASVLKEDRPICITIDECEVSNLKFIIEESLPGYIIRPVVIEYNHRGRVKSNFAITHEYALWAIPEGKDIISRQREISSDISRNLRRTGTDSRRRDSKKQFFGIEVDNKTLEILSVSDPLLPVTKPIPKNLNANTTIVWPVDDDGVERRWYYGKDRVVEEAKKGTVWAKKIKGDIQVHYRKAGKPKMRKSIWTGQKLDASTYGSELLNNMFGAAKIEFSFPKSLYAVMDCIDSISQKSDSIIFDFFAGSGTTAHAAIQLNREFGGNRKFVLVEQGAYFESVTQPRVKKAIYSEGWSKGKPKRTGGISSSFKYIRLESYEDALNNLVLQNHESRDRSIKANPDLARDYYINYFLKVETEGSQSLLNIQEFKDPMAYRMWVKKPGSEEQVEKTIDLIETFNWLLGLWVDHLGAPQVFSAEFTREKDADLPEDKNTRLLCSKLKQDINGPYWFRLIEGYALRTPGDDSTKQSTLVIWRKQTDNPEKDNAVLQAYLEKIGISSREKTYDVIYINGSHTLPNPVVEGEHTRVRLTEEAFHNAMWAETA